LPDAVPTPVDVTPFFNALPNAGPADPSRSGDDWRKTLSQLRRGADPRTLIAQLAESRRDKAQPEAYAKRTVSRALALIRSTPNHRRRPI
jgi:hypothetical protein